MPIAFASVRVNRNSHLPRGHAEHQRDSVRWGGDSNRRGLDRARCTVIACSACLSAFCRPTSDSSARSGRARRRWHVRTGDPSCCCAGGRGGGRARGHQSRTAPPVRSGTTCSTQRQTGLRGAGHGRHRPLPTHRGGRPESPAYFVHGPDRGDDMANWSPDEALPVILSRGRTPLTLTEGMHWLLQQPDTLERNHCFMTIGSRLRKSDGSWDSRTPALWISNGTGRDGSARRNAPKVGWCWAGNRHTWLGFASAVRRSPAKT